MSEIRMRGEAARVRPHRWRGGADARPEWGAPRPREPLPAELAPFEGMLDPALLEGAARRAAALGVGGDEVLRCHGIVLDDLIVQSLSAHLGLPLDPLDEDEAPQHLEAACAGVLARPGPYNQPLITVAPRGDGIRRLLKALQKEPRLRRRLRIASPARLAHHVRRVCAAELAQAAVYGLHAKRPDLSAVGYRARQLRWFTILFSAAVISAGTLAPDQIFIALQYFLAFSFLSWSLLRLLACFVPSRRAAAGDVPDRLLPIYTIIVPLYREAAVVQNLIAALLRLDYPREKMDIKLLLEPEDAETRLAVAELGLGAPFEVIGPPRAGPRTKPRALAAALPFARGSLITIYDAEDEPEPDQLRKAAAAFVAGPRNLACVQARLAIDNVADSWLSRHFAAEYAGQFDVFLPALARLRLPLPLGGTSNHFRTDALRRVGGWDPFNVTEDADLGMRLARFGYRTGVLDSSTWEEAPVGHRQWLRQRTRWFKGWLQTWIVHMRHPLRLWRELGPGGFLALQLLVGGTVLSALVHPFFLILVAADAWSGALLASAQSVEEEFRKDLALITLIGGYLGAALFGLIGLAHRRLLGSAWVLLTIPAYWVLLSVAAWRALYYLVRDPYHWEKTEHGLARSSLRAARRKATPPRAPIPRPR